MRYAVLKADGVTVAWVVMVRNADQAAEQPVPPGGSIVLIPDDAPVGLNNMTHQYDPGTQTFVTRVVPLVEAQTTKITELQAACDAAIIGGFTSSALGSVKHYGSNDTDQTNMARVAVIGGDLMCATNISDNPWTLVTHTAVQGLTVYQDFGTMADTARAHLVSLKASVMAAADNATVNAITW